jgi:CheY-like chemotaxis protein
MAVLEEKPANATKQELLQETLSSGKKKRKKYVLLAINEQFDPELQHALENYLEKKFSTLSVLTVRNNSDMQRILNRQLMLVVIHDKLAPLEETLGWVKIVKAKNQEKPIPILFLTENEEALLEAYSRLLLPFQEVDNYVVFRNSTLVEIEERIDKALDVREARRSRRFVTDISVRFTSLQHADLKIGKITNLSVHGALLEAGKEAAFRLRDQLQVRMPVGSFLPREHGEFLSLSGRVERVFLGGNQVGISWTHLSETQFLTLTTFVLHLASQQSLKGHTIPLPGHG